MTRVWLPNCRVLVDTLRKTVTHQLSALSWRCDVQERLWLYSICRIMERKNEAKFLRHKTDRPSARTLAWAP
jgi:hypothetical protein